MRYLTERKRAEGRGAAGSGTERHWYMSVSAVGLAVMVPTFLFIFGRALGGGREEVLAAFSDPFAAILTGMVLVVGLQHFRRGAQIMIEDYAHGTNRRVLVIFVITFTYFLMATGIYALAKIAL